jgi:hypothetical protein
MEPNTCATIGLNGFGGLILVTLPCSHNADWPTNSSDAGSIIALNARHR